MPITLDFGNPDLSLVRQAFLERLRKNPGWDQIDADPRRGFAPYIEVSPNAHEQGIVLEIAIGEVFWQLVSEGIVMPGNGGNHAGFPQFRLTQYGRSVLSSGSGYAPVDQLGYLTLLRQRVPNPDGTVLAYLEESLSTFHRNSFVASTVMLGVAAERVFDLICDSMLQALKSPHEKRNLEADMGRMNVKPRLDRVALKLHGLQEAGAVPENTDIAVSGIFNLIRTQRNEFGHPRANPPRPDRLQAQANLLIFPSYYETAEQIRAYLASNQV